MIASAVRWLNNPPCCVYPRHFFLAADEEVYPVSVPVGPVERPATPSHFGRLQWENSDKSRAVQLLNRIFEQELAGVVRYTHYSLLVFGYNRMIVAWLREQATEFCCMRNKLVR